MALHNKWSSGDQIWYDGTQIVFTIQDDDEGLLVGYDGNGVDVKFYGDTTGTYMLWDESADTLVLSGSAKITYPDPTTTETTGSTGLLTLTTASQRMQFVSSSTGSASKITLPATASCAGIEFKIANTGSTGIITVLTTGASTVAVIPVLGTAYVLCDGTSWSGLVGLGSTY